MNKITADIKYAAQLLANGAIVAFPTETVYGLGADACNESAILKVFQAKGRPADHPLIVHISSIDEINSWAIDVPKAAWILAEQFWPGPLTLILKKHPQVSSLITGGQDTIALRIPKHPQTLELLREFGSGIVGPSANKYRHISPTTAAHVADDLNDQVAAILDGGACAVGIESTIVNLLEDPPQIMRQGAITAEQLERVLKIVVPIADLQQSTIRTSGSHALHYAPRTPLFVFDLPEIIAKIENYNQPCSVISFHLKPNNLPNNVYWHTISTDPSIYAHDLYTNLRIHDQLNNSAIFVEQVPNDTAWLAIADRLMRASAK